MYNTERQQTQLYSINTNEDRVTRHNYDMTIFVPDVSLQFPTGVTGVSHLTGGVAIDSDHCKLSSQEN
jgi:hypothetical protein